MGRNYDPADLDKYMQDAESSQSFSTDRRDKEHFNNPYSGFDDLKPTPIKDEYIYALVHVDKDKQISNEQPYKVKYFFSQATFDKFIDPKTGNHDATALNDALQIDPADYPNYRDSIVCFKVHPEKVKGGELILPAGVCLANTQLGRGGAHQAFAPEDISIDLQNSGALEIIPEKSFAHTGHNTEVDPDRRTFIDNAKDERWDNCITNGTKHHDKSQTYDHEFPENPNLIQGKPFETTKATTTEATKTKILFETKPVDKMAYVTQQKTIGSPQTKSLIKKNPNLDKNITDVKSDSITMSYNHKSATNDKDDISKKMALNPNSDTSSKMADTKDEQPVFKGLHDLQKYLDQSEQAEQSKGLVLSNDDFCLQ